MNLQTILFIGGFLIILGGFIFSVRLLSQRLSAKISQTSFEVIERVFIGGIIIGVVCMFQPWLFIGYKYGFLIVLFSTLAFIAWSHVTPAAPLYGEEDFVAVSAGEVAEPEATSNVR